MTRETEIPLTTPHMNLAPSNRLISFYCLMERQRTQTHPLCGMDMRGLHKADGTAGTLRKTSWHPRRHSQDKLTADPLLKESEVCDTLG